MFGGRVHYIYVDTERETNHRRVFFDRNWSRQEFTFKYPLETRDIERPVSLEMMIQAAEILGRDWSFVRVDFYEVGGKPKFGEMTFYPESGCEKFEPVHYDYEFGDLCAGQM